MFFFLYRDTGISRLGSRWVLGYPGGLSRCPSGVPGYRDIPVPGYPGTGYPGAPLGGTGYRDTGISRCPSGGSVTLVPLRIGIGTAVSRSLRSRRVVDTTVSALASLAPRVMGTTVSALASLTPRVMGTTVSAPAALTPRVMRTTTRPFSPSRPSPI